MPRNARIYAESNYLHVIVQGIDRQYIFSNDELKKAYKLILKKNLSDSNVEILAYCVMDNHVHLLLYSERIEYISKLMQKTNTSFAKLYNKVNHRVGYVFRDRYYSQMIKSEIQLFNCLVYIHNNPVKANIVKNMKDYKYSSYIEYLQRKELISKKGIELIFGSGSNYIDTFYEIHKVSEIEDIIDVYDNYEDWQYIVNEFIHKTNKTLDEIKENEEIFAKLLIDLRHKAGLSLRNMAKILNINKDKLMKIINKSL